jgi:hypothetical protein
MNEGFGSGNYVSRMDEFIGALNEDKIVISDVRFRNEAEEIKWRHGQVWRISRIEKDGPINIHRSETDMDSWDFDQYISNNGTFEELSGLVKEILWKKT